MALMRLSLAVALAVSCCGGADALGFYMGLYMGGHH